MLKNKLNQKKKHMSPSGQRLFAPEVDVEFLGEQMDGVD